MLNFTKVALAAAMVAGACGSAHASGLGVELNGARSYGVWGAELGVGYRAKFGIFDITPAGGVFLYKGDSDYFTTHDSNGDHCRAPNGQFAKKSQCDNTAAKAYARVEAGVSIPAVARVAVGGRFIGSQVKPYGAASFAIAPKLAVKVNGGQHYGAAGITFGF